MASYLVHRLGVNLKRSYYTSADELLCTKIELLGFKITLPWTKLDTVGSKILSNGFIFSDDIPVNIHLVTYLLISTVTELKIGEKTKKLW